MRTGCAPKLTQAIGNCKNEHSEPSRATNNNRFGALQVPDNNTRNSGGFHNRDNGYQNQGGHHDSRIPSS
jgi:hypothetical protein